MVSSGTSCFGFWFFGAYFRNRDVRNRLPNLTTRDNYDRFNLCFHANYPTYDVSEVTRWANSQDGHAFCSAMVHRLAQALGRDEFILLVLSLLSYYRILNRNYLFVPTRDCRSFYSELWKLSDASNMEENGSLLERVAFAVIDTGSRLLLPVITVPYMRPYQLDACMEHNASTMRLDVYCYARMSRSCSHQGAVHCMNEVFGAETWHWPVYQMGNIRVFLSFCLSLPFPFLSFSFLKRIILILIDWLVGCI